MIKRVLGLVLVSQFATAAPSRVLDGALDVLEAHVEQVYARDGVDFSRDAAARVARGGVLATAGIIAGTLVIVGLDGRWSLNIPADVERLGKFGAALTTGVAMWGGLAWAVATPLGLRRDARSPDRARRRALVAFLRRPRAEQLARLEGDPALAEFVVGLARLLQAQDQMLAAHPNTLSTGGF